MGTPRLICRATQWAKSSSRFLNRFSFFSCHLCNACPSAWRALGRCAREWWRGGVPAAAAGTLVIFAGGGQESITALQPLLGPLAARVSHMGPAGAGQTTKICNQMVVACIVMLIAEMIALARKAGLDVGALPASLKGGFADSLPLQIFGPRMAAHRFEPRLGAIALMEKDVNLAAALSAQNNAYTPMLERARQLYATARDQSGVDVAADISKLVCLFESLSLDEKK